MRDLQNVIVIGEEIEAALPALLPSLETHGLRVMKAQGLGDLRVLLPEGEAATIVAYEPAGSNAVRRILSAVSKMEQRIPVVVVAERGSFDEYYELMSEGAYDYFDLREGAGPIERSVEWAAIGSRAA